MSSPHLLRSIDSCQSAPFLHIRLFFLFSALLFLCYANTYHAAWQLDDKPNILANGRIQITELSAEKIWQSMTAKPGSGGFYRPVACVSLALNWFFGGDIVFGYHVVNFLIHLATSWTLFLTLCALFQAPKLKGNYSYNQSIFIAGTAAIFWAVNPVQTQAVTYIVQRMASMAAMFAVLSLYCYLKARIETNNKRKRNCFLLISLAFYVLGFLSKENVFLLPLSIPVIEVLFFSDQFLKSAKTKILIIGGLFICICVFFGFLIRPDGIDFIFNYYENRPFTIMERVLTEQRVLLFYLSLLLYPSPSRLSIDHDVLISSSLFEPWTTAAAICGNAILILGALKFRRKFPFLSLAILFFYLNHIVESTVVPLELVFEHRNYLPSVFLFLPIAQTAGFWVERGYSNKRLLTLTIVLLCIIIGLKGFATFTRNKVWKTEQSLWLDAMAKAPKSARPVATVAILLAWGDHPTPAKLRKALELTERSLSLRMARKLEAEQLGNMASIYDKLGQTEQAIIYYQKALAVAPKKVNNRYNYAKVLIGSGHFESARSELKIILDEGSVHADYLLLLGFTDLWLGETDRALPLLRRALKLSPNRPDILLSIGNCLSSMGYYDRARLFLGLSEKVGGRDVVVSLNRVQNEIFSGDLAKAREAFLRATRLFPLPKILDVLDLSNRSYRSVPLNRQRLKSFIKSEMPLFIFP